MWPFRSPKENAFGSKLSRSLERKRIAKRCTYKVFPTGRRRTSGRTASRSLYVVIVSIKASQTQARLTSIPSYRSFLQVGERVSLAGQIPLIPHTLALPSPASFSKEAALSLKHVRSIVKALKESIGGSWESEYIEGCIGWVLDFERDLEGARKGWKAAFEGIVDPSSPFPRKTGHVPPTLFVEPSSLPKGALVEWQVSLHTGRAANPIVTDYTDDNEDEDVKPPVWNTPDAGEDVGAWEEGVFEEGEARWGVAVFESVGKFAGLDL